MKPKWSTATSRNWNPGRSAMDQAYGSMAQIILEPPSENCTGIFMLG